MTRLNPYLNFKGNTEEAFNFYKSVFGGDIPMLVRFKDTPEASRVPANEQDKIMNISLCIGDTVLMGTDALESMGHHLNPGNNFSLSYSAKTREEADNIFSKLSADGKVAVPMQQQFWGAYFGMFTDKFGINWMLSHDPNYEQ